MAAGLEPLGAWTAIEGRSGVSDWEEDRVGPRRARERDTGGSERRYGAAQEAKLREERRIEVRLARHPQRQAADEALNGCPPFCRVKGRRKRVRAFEPSIEERNEQAIHG